MTVTISCLLALGLVAGGCGSDETAEPAAEEASAVCDDIEALRDSLDRLGEAEVGENAVSVLSTELTDVRRELQMLRDDASDEYATELDAVSNDLEGLETSIEAAVSTPTTATLSEVSAEVRAVVSALDDLGEAVGNSC